MGEDPRADYAAPADPRDRINRPAARQHVVYGYRSHHPRLSTLCGWIR